MASAPIIEEPIEGEEEQAPLIMRLAAENGDLTQYFTDTELATLGSDVVADYERDCQSRSEWAEKAEAALKSASQEEDRSDIPLLFDGASDVQYPILTQSAIEFNARAYAAICKGDETVQVKVVGSDRGRPEVAQTPQGIVPVPQMQMNTETGMEEPVMGPDGKPAVVWAIPPGAKLKRANRVKEYLNVLLNYRMKGWEADTDTLLLQLPIVGCGFRKVYWDARTKLPCARYVPALRLVVPMDAMDLETAPRITEVLDGEFPYQIRQRMATGEYRQVDLGAPDDDTEKARTLLEQHRLIDLDEDGYEEPYVVTVDKESREVLRVIAAFQPEDVVANDNGGVTIERTCFYVKYDFFPHPEGKFYGIGFGHLLAPIIDVINTALNQMIDAGHAQIAGGGFIASGVRLQGNGQSNTLRWRPSEYKMVNVPGGDLRNAIYERTFPNASALMFQVLELMLGAAKDVAALKDVLSGDASNMGQVGTTMALIEQGLQVFTAIYKRIFRAEKEEFGLIYDLVGKYGDEQMAEDYMTVLDDPEADLQTDFTASDMDIRPVSDPGSVTRTQKVARAQFLLQTGQNNPVVDQHELMKRVYEAADIEDIDKLLPPPDPQAPPPPEMLKAVSEAKKNDAQAELYLAQADEARAKTADLGFKVGHATGVAEGGGAPHAEPEAQEPPMGTEPAGEAEMPPQMPAMPQMEPEGMPA